MPALLQEGLYQVNLLPYLHLHERDLLEPSDDMAFDTTAVPANFRLQGHKNPPKTSWFISRTEDTENTLMTEFSEQANLDPQQCLEIIYTQRRTLLILHDSSSCASCTLFCTAFKVKTHTVDLPHSFTSDLTKRATETT
jgi:hypothetical protein